MQGTLKQITLLTLVLFPKSFFAQDNKFLNPQLKVSGEYFFESGLDDSLKSSFGLSKGTFGFMYPLLSERNSLTNDLEYKTVVALINLNASYVLPYISFLDSQHQLLSATVGPSLIYNSGNKNTYLAAISAGIAQDVEILGSLTPRFAGHALFKHKSNGNFSYHIGVVYSYSYGRGLPLPILGCVLRTSHRSKLKMTLPLSIAWSYKTNPFDMFTAFVQPNGDQFNFAANDSTLGNRVVARFKIRGFKTGVNYKLGVSGRFFFTPEIGYSFRRKISFADASTTAASNDYFYSAGAENSFYIKLSARILLGNLKWKRNGDNFLLNDERLDYYDLDDPTKL